MADLLDLIRQYPELSDVLDRLDSRIKDLELANEPSLASREQPVREEKPEEPAPAPKQDFQQLKGMVLHLQNKVNDLTIKKKVGDKAPF